MGPGCGKSTLLRAVARLHRPDSGTVPADAHDLRRPTRRQAARHIALASQSPRAPGAGARLTRWTTSTANRSVSMSSRHWRSPISGTSPRCASTTGA
ncbi:ATP-binding cassette domain-containing protein [Streptomyces sp. NPDC059122]|uniref:ATP-binding cassette domain-containing protein n=1 Tax=Streptomyces sp. NPDC059122 TaxID=3346732 RepID=UPI0036CB5414